LAIAAGGHEGLTPVQVQKTLFLLGDKCSELVGEHFYEFKPYDYGPFDVAVYDDARKLEADGLVSISPDPGHRFNMYRITVKGADAKLPTAQFPTAAVDYLRAVVDWAKPLTFSQLVTSIYKAYPEMRENAVFEGAR